MRPKILIIDDEVEYLKLLQLHLIRLGYDIYTASDPLKGVQAAIAVQPDLIILDIAMPRLNGWMVMKKLELNEETAGIPIIITSVLIDRAEPTLGYTKGAYDFSPKLARQTDLQAVIERVLSRQHPHRRAELHHLRQPILRQSDEVLAELTRFA